MPNKKSHGRRDIRTSRRLFRIVLAALVPAILISLVGGAFIQQAQRRAGQERRKPTRITAPASSAIAQTTPTPPVLTKEYLYSGQLVATIEPLKFTDVFPANQYYEQILQIAQAEVTIGTSPGFYTPDGVVTRASMAIFIVRSLGYYDLPTPTVQRFADVPLSLGFTAAAIDKMAVLGITLGCGGGNYCPNDPVGHDQMAAFMIRSCMGATTPPTPGSQRYLDVLPSHIFYAHIDLYAVKNVWFGCGAGNFCPTSSVLREQMAKILVNNFNLTATPDWSKLSDGNDFTHPRSCKWSYP